MEMQNIKNIKL